jgi:hypothetical protein
VAVWATTKGTPLDTSGSFWSSGELKATTNTRSMETVYSLFSWINALYTGRLKRQSLLATIYSTPIFIPSPRCAGRQDQGATTITDTLPLAAAVAPPSDEMAAAMSYSPPSAGAIQE